MRAGWKHQRIQTKLTRRLLPEEIPFSHPPLGSALFSSSPSATQVLLDMGSDTLLTMPSLMKWDLSSRADRWSSYYREGSAWLLASLETQHCDGTAPATYLTLWPHNLEAHIGSPGRWQLWSVGAEFHWQTKGSKLLCVSAVWKEETSGTEWLWNQKMAAPVVRVLAFLPVFQGGPGLGKGILAFSDCTHDFICPSALIICIRSRFHKPFSCETRLVTRVNYSVVRGNIMMEKK